MSNSSRLDSLSRFGVCVGGGAEPVDPVVEVGFVPGLEVEALPAWVEDEVDAEVLPSPALQN